MTPVALRAMVDYIMERDARIVGKTVVGDKSPNMKTGGQAIAEYGLDLSRCAGDQYGTRWM